MNRDWSPFAPPSTPKPPLPEPPPEVRRAPSHPDVRAWAQRAVEKGEQKRKVVEAVAAPIRDLKGSLAEQVAEAVKWLVMTKNQQLVATQVGVTPNTIARVVSGIGINTSTLEKLCVWLGWTLTIRDSKGQVIVQLLPKDTA